MSESAQTREQKEEGYSRRSLTGGFICVMPTTLAMADSAAMMEPSVSGYSSPSCSKRTRPSLLRWASSPHCLMTTARRVVRSAACWRTLALLLLSRQRMVETIWVR